MNVTTTLTQPYIADTDSLALFEAALDGIASTINNVPVAVIRDRALRTEHFGFGLANPNWPPVVHSGAQHTYTVSGDGVDYNAFGQDGATDRAVFGDPATPGLYDGPFAVIERTWDPDGEYREMIVDFDAELLFVSDSELESGRGVMACVQVRMGGVWLTVDHTERFLSVRDRYVDSRFGPINMPITTHLFRANLPGGAGSSLSVTGVRIMVSIINAGPTSAMTWQNWSFSAVPMLSDIGGI